MSSSHRKCPIILNAVCEVDIGCVISSILMLAALDDSLHQITPGCRHTPSTKHWTQCGRRWASCIQHLGILHSLCRNGSSSPWLTSWQREQIVTQYQCFRSSFSQCQMCIPAYLYLFLMKIRITKQNFWVCFPNLN